MISLLGKEYSRAWPTAVPGAFSHAQPRSSPRLQALKSSLGEPQGSAGEPAGEWQGSSPPSCRGFHSGTVVAQLPLATANGAGRNGPLRTFRFLKSHTTYRVVGFLVLRVRFRWVSGPTCPDSVQVVSSGRGTPDRALHLYRSHRTTNSDLCHRRDSGPSSRPIIGLALRRASYGPQNQREALRPPSRTDRRYGARL